MGESLMGIHQVDNHVEVRLDEQNVVMVVAELAQPNQESKAVLMLAEFTTEDKENEGFPYVLNNKPITDVPHIALTFNDVEQIDKLIRMLELQKETLVELESGSIVDKIKKESEHMTIKDKVFEDLKTAMKVKDTLKKGVLQIVKANLDMAEKEKGSQLTENEEITVIQKELKQVKQSIEGAKKAKRQDIILQEEMKLTILESYLPKQLSFDDIVPILCQKGVHDGMNMGEAMKIAKEHLTGKTDNGTIAKAVKHIITGGVK